MWNLYASSKIVQRRSQEKRYQTHRERLKSMQPTLRVEPPQQPDFVYTKNKLNMSRRDRRIEIDKHNQILLSKMEAIKHEQSKTTRLRPEAQNLRTLNAHLMETMNEQIVNENRKMCEKLLRTKSYYPTNNILGQTDQLEYVSQNISHNARRAFSQRNLHSARPKSSYTAFSKSSRKKSVENLRLASRYQSSEWKSGERPETAPTFTRSGRAIVVPQSGRPQVNYEGQESEPVQIL